MFVGIDVAYMINLEFKYRPEVDDIIYTGLINCRNWAPTGQIWNDFADKVIKAFQDPMFEKWPRLPPTATPDQVEANAG